MIEKPSNLKMSIIKKTLFSIAISVMFIMVAFDMPFSNDSLISSMIQNSIVRIFGGVIFLSIMFSFGYKYMFKFHNVVNSIIIVIPALIISINNFPISAFFSGRTVFTGTGFNIFIFMIECLSVGFFEEIIFRVVLLFLLLQKLPKSKKGVFLSIVISSIIFSFMHLLNLFSGGSLSNTIMQMGYSFLVGMMWAVMYLKTKNIWIIILLHATYNFFGNVLFQFGSVTNRFDLTTVIVTIIFGVIVALYSIKIFLSLTVDPLE